MKSVVNHDIETDHVHFFIHIFILIFEGVVEFMDLFFILKLMEQSILNQEHIGPLSISSHLI